MPLDEKEVQLKEMLERIHKKIESSHALNGGFDKMMIVVQHIKDKQDETCDKVDELFKGLHQPDTGLYARVKTIEDNTKHFNQRYEEHVISDEDNLTEINTSLKKISTQNFEEGRVTEKLKSVAGDDLEKLNSILKIRTFFNEVASKAAWLLVGGALTGAGKVLWEIFSK